MSKVLMYQRDLLIDVIRHIEQGKDAPIIDVLTVGELDELREIREQFEEEKRREDALNAGHPVKCRVQMCDPDNRTEPPFRFITLSEFEIEETNREADYGGTERFRRLFRACAELGYRFKSYNLSDAEGYKYDVTVYN